MYFYVFISQSLITKVSCLPGNFWDQGQTIQSKYITSTCVDYILLLYVCYKMIEYIFIKILHRRVWWRYNSTYRYYTKWFIGCYQSIILKFLWKSLKIHINMNKYGLPHIQDIPLLNYLNFHCAQSISCMFKSQILLRNWRI